MEEYKEYKIEFSGSFTGYVIKNTGQGPVPNNLKGHFTSKDFARQAIDRHLVSKKEKEDAKPKTRSKG